MTSNVNWTTSCYRGLQPKQLKMLGFLFLFNGLVDHPAIWPNLTSGGRTFAQICGGPSKPQGPWLR